MAGLAKKYDLFVFDWDGTLSKSVRLLTQKFDPFWKYKMVKQGRLQPGKKIDQKTAERVLVRRRGSNIERRVLTPLADISLIFIKPKLYYDAKPVLDTLRRRRKKVALFTNGAAWRVAKELAYLDLLDYFDVIISAQDLKALKPNPMGLEVTARALKVRLSKVLYIGDTVDDVMMAKYAKAHSCALSQGLDSGEMLRAAKPDHLFRSIEEFRKAL